jgi:hypothetical protein
MQLTSVRKPKDLKNPVGWLLLYWTWILKKVAEDNTFRRESKSMGSKMPST